MLQFDEHYKEQKLNRDLREFKIILRENPRRDFAGIPYPAASLYTLLDNSFEYVGNSQ
jgi:hypothetical protein